jgi:hypothetical protein
MHPEILREMTAQRGRDLVEQARLVQLARTVSRARRAGRHAARRAGELVVPAIPDYVDGSFRTVPAGEERARVPAARRAA